MNKVKIDNLAAELTKTLKDYANATEEEVSQAVTSTAKEICDELKHASPSGSGQYGSWDKYNSSWKVKQTKTDKKYHKQATVHNEKYYRLTHLLEKGHALVSGGRKVGNTKAFEHIAPVADKAEGKLLEKIKRGINNA